MISHVMANAGQTCDCDCEDGCQVLAAGLMLIPRCTAWLFSPEFPELSDELKATCFDPLAVHGNEWGLALFLRAFPQVALAVNFNTVSGTTCASFWKRLNVASGLTRSLLWEFGLAWKVWLHIAGRRERDQMYDYRCFRTHVFYAVSGLVVLLLWRLHQIWLACLLADCVLILSSVVSCVAPMSCLCEGRNVAAVLHGIALASSLALAPVEGSTVLFVGILALPGAMAWIGVEATLRGRGFASRIVIDRSRLIDSSVEQVLKFGRSNLVLPLQVAYTSGPGSPQSLETGIDAGGIRRDWISEVAGELFGPQQGLFEDVLIDGVEYSRLRQGGNLERLHVAGTLLGLALRERHPVGINLVAPLAHLLAHPSLPEVLKVLAIIAADGSETGRRKDHSCCHNFFSRSLARSRAVAELHNMGFNREWLRWVSPEEYGYWSQRLSSSSVHVWRARHEVAQRALQALVLDVAAETCAFWRGLRLVPNVPLPDLKDEVEISQLRRLELECREGVNSATGYAPPCHRRKSQIKVSDATGALDLFFCDFQEDERMKDKALGDSFVGNVSPIAGSPWQVRDETVRQGHKRPRDDAVEPQNRDACERFVTPPQKKMRATQASSQKIAGQAASKLQSMVSGDPEINVERWKAWTYYQPAGAELTQHGIATVKWLWQYIEGLNVDGRSKLLQWVTGYRRLPFGGFPDPHLKMTVHLLLKDGNERLPRAHTCALQLDIPAQYTSETVLGNRLAEAVAHVQFFLT